MKHKILLTLVCILSSLFSYGIDVKIENARIDLDARDDDGDPMIATHCKLNVNGIKGKSFDLVAIVKDDTGEWHTDSRGNTVKTHYKCTAPYEETEWKDIQVFLRHNKLSPKPGKHTYKVYLYVYYNGEWYDGTYAGSYDQTGASRSSSSSSSSSSSRSNSYANSSSSRSNSSSSSTVTTCGVCQGGGITTCLLCSGAGGSQQWRCLTVPPYSSYYVWVNCVACGGQGRVYCTWCGGDGQIEVQTNNYNNNYNNNTYGGTTNYNNNYNYYDNSSSSSSSGSYSVYTTCRICGGSGVCTSCHGSGGEWRDTGYYTGSNSQSWIACPSCKGNKKCFNCYGTGKQ